MHGDTPYIVRGAESFYKEIFYSDPAQALTKPITIPAGFGLVKAGTVLALIYTSTSPKYGKYVPYPPEQPPIGSEAYPGLAYLTQDGAASVYAWVTKEDSYRFALLDVLIAADYNSYNGSAVDLGAVAAIDRTTYTHLAKLTMTNNVTTAFTVAQGGAVFHKTAAAAPFTYAVGILMAAVDTGKGENAKGANGVLIVSNAILYKDRLQGWDTEVATDLGATTDGSFVILK